MRKYLHINIFAITAMTCFVLACDDNTDKPEKDNYPDAPNCKTPGAVICSDVCIDPMTSNKYCGANQYCENYETCGETRACKDGKCQASVISCEQDEHLYENECEKDSLENCGEHGVKCSGGQCVNGRCQTVCNGVMHDTLADLDHCGECNHRCDNGLMCDKGECKLGNGPVYCDEGNFTTEIGTFDRCSSCTDRCADGQICKDFACVAGAGETSCLFSYTDFYGEFITPVRVNTLDDVTHCGSCNHKCDEGLICSEGQCIAGNGEMYCNGIRINSTYDSAHCGGCGNLCPAGSYCMDDSGVVGCYDEEYYVNAGVAYGVICSGRSIRGFRYDSANCGQCGKLCGVGEICESGVCVEGIGTTYCNGHDSIDISSDSANCGQCGKICKQGFICQSGICQTGIGDTFCNHEVTNTSNDFFNCGQCFHSCEKNQSCINGTCMNYVVGGVTAFASSTSFQWYILDIDTTNHRLLVLSMNQMEYSIHCYNEKRESVTWADSSIRRSFLNDEFLYLGLMDEYGIRIPKVQIINDDNPNYGTPGGENTTDQVFLLSIDEVNRLLGPDICSKIHCKGNWWLRSPGLYDYKAAYVSADGRVYSDGDDVDRSKYIRPAMWVQY